MVLFNIIEGSTLLLKAFMWNIIWLPNHVTNDVINFFSSIQFSPGWPSKIFILIRCSVPHMQLWHHNEGTDDVIKKNITLIPQEGYLLSAKFIFVSWCGFVDRGPKFSVFPTWLVKILSQSDKRLRRKTRNCCADKQTNKKKTLRRARYLQNPTPSPNVSMNTLSCPFHSD